MIRCSFWFISQKLQNIEVRTDNRRQVMAIAHTRKLHVKSKNKTTNLDICLRNNS
jgi:hypothetical protein